MILHSTPLAGVTVVEMQPRGDERGHLARWFCADTFAAAGLELHVAQANLSFNAMRGTLRGLHYQAHPKWEPKLVRCNRGRIFDVAVDLRPDSDSYCRWFAVELDAAGHRALYLPRGCAHGFLTLSDDVEIAYLMGEPYDPDLARGVRWDDPAFAIHWPEPPTMISDRDAGFADFDPDKGPR